MSDASHGFGVGDLDFEGLISREWLSTNHIGGFASSTIAGLNTRRYHGLLVAAMAPPVRRMVLLSRVEETVTSDDREYYLACNEYPGAVWPKGHEHLRAFNTDPFPRWGYQGDGWTLEKQLRLLPGENTVVLSYVLLGGGRGVELAVRPLLALRGMHELAYQWNGRLAAEPREPRDGRDGRSRGHWHVPATSRTPEVFFAHDGNFDRGPTWYLSTIYRREGERGYPGLEDLWSPGVVRMRLSPGQPVHFACSSEPFDLEQVVSRSTRHYAAAAVSAVTPIATPTETAGRHGAPSNGAAPATSASASGDATLDVLLRAASAMTLGARDGESLGCAIQYHWSPPSPRAALISLAGLYLVPHRLAEARALLMSLVPHLRDGLLPTEFPEDGSLPVYHGVDVSLWFVNAVYQYHAYTNDDATIRRYLFEPVLQIIDAYRHGTGLGITTDMEGLLVSRAQGFGATWMDAKAGDWVVTPRQGRAVEVNALWYNAICIATEFARRYEQPARAEHLCSLAHAVWIAFNRRFWNEAGGYCFDVIEDGVAPDAVIRPNQLLAVSLPFPVLAGDPVLSEEREMRMVETIMRELLTPMGVRTLCPKDPGYQGHFGGNAHARDRAYHNGSAFPWLLGPLVTGLLRVRGRGQAVRDEARRILEPCVAHLRGAGLGQLPELFDGNTPHRPGGAIASPLSIGEVLRCYYEDVLDRAPSAVADARACDPHNTDLPAPPQAWPTPHNA